MQGAAAYLVGNRVCMHAEMYTIAGFGIAGEPAICVEDASDAEAIGHALEKALSASRRGVPNPDFTHGASQYFSFFLKAAKVRSWRALVTRAKHVSVARDGEIVYLAPSRSDGRSFEQLSKNKHLIVESPTAEELGAALIKAFSRCAYAAALRGQHTN